MRVVRLVVNILLWASSVFGIFGALLWVGQTTHQLKPLIVISGSMTPGIKVGDLLLDRPMPVEDAKVGQIVSLPSQAGDLVSHRAIKIKQIAGGYAFTLKGDANADPDGTPYDVQAGTKIWHPWLHLPRVGFIIQNMGKPRVIYPLLIALVALSILTSLKRPEKEPSHRDDGSPEPAEKSVEEPAEASADD